MSYCILSLELGLLCLISLANFCNSIRWNSNIKEWKQNKDKHFESSSEINDFIRYWHESQILILRYFFSTNICHDFFFKKQTEKITCFGEPFWVKIVVILWIYSALQVVFFFLTMRKITWLNSQQPKTRGHGEHLHYHTLNQRENCFKV